jgi:hypothetical protein
MPQRLGGSADVTRRRTGATFVPSGGYRHRTAMAVWRSGCGWAGIGAPVGFPDVTLMSALGQ